MDTMSAEENVQCLESDESIYDFIDLDDETEANEYTRGYRPSEEAVELPF